MTSGRRRKPEKLKSKEEDKKDAINDCQDEDVVIGTSKVTGTQDYEITSKTVLNLTKKEAKELRELSSIIATSASGKIKENAERICELLKSVKKKRHRTILTTSQNNFLYSMFEKDAFPATEVREELARSIGVPQKTVQIWFQNQRQKHKHLLMNLNWSGLDLLAEAASYASHSIGDSMKNGIKVCGSSKKC